MGMPCGTRPRARQYNLQQRKDFYCKVACIVYLASIDRDDAARNQNETMDQETRQQKEYLIAYNRAIAAINAIKDALHEMPHPHNDITWSDVANMLRYANVAEEASEAIK